MQAVFWILCHPIWVAKRLCNLHNNSHNIIHLLECCKNIYALGKISTGYPSILAISHLFWQFHTFFHTFSIFLNHIIHLLRRYKNIYDLHRFSIENFFILAISHLFWRFHTFFSHLFPIFFCSALLLSDTQLSKKK